MKAIIVDDEQPAIDIMKILLENDGRIKVAHTFRKPREALIHLPDCKPDVAFLDIHMPMMNGMELGERLLELYEDMEIVFVTAYDYYALEAFRLNAIDYILKPVTKEHLERTINRLLKIKGKKELQKQQPLRQTRMNCFGEFKLVSGILEPSVVKWRTAKTEELMAYLYIKGQNATKWDIIEALWPECSQEQAHSNLHTTLYKLKKTLKEAQIDCKIGFKSGAYRMELNDFVCDHQEFIRFAQTETVVNQGNATEYTNKLDLYKGELFGELDYAWSLMAKEQCETLFNERSKQLCHFLIDRGNYQEAAERLRLLLKKSLLDEEAHEMLIKVYFLQKERVALIKHYQKLAELLRTELGLEPRESITKIYIKTVNHT